MSSRRIPISSNQRTHPSNPNSNQNNHQQQTTPFRSSLDLVFSFSRSAGFFGENLPSGPSFVDEQRYRPPNYNPEDDTEEDEGDTQGDDDDGDDDDDDAYSVATHDREPSGASDQYEVDLSVDNAQEEGVFARTAGISEQLPRNAKRLPQVPRAEPARLPRSILSSSPVHAGSASHLSRSSSPPPAVPHATFDDDHQHNERTPLVASDLSLSHSRSGRRRRSSQGGAKKPSYGTLRDPAALESQTGSLGGFGKRKRRASTFSKEAWKAAIEEHRGESTWFQSLFNTVNVLVGVGLLAEPLAFAYGGWFLGTVLLVFCALITNYTAKMLAALMRLDPTQHTYADVLIKAFGPRSRRWIYALFVIELGTFSVATIELFADSLNSLFPKISSNLFKTMSYFIIVPTTFLPLRLLSLTSLIGILSSVVLLSVIIADGTLKTHSPGSLWEPMPTSFGPNWKKLPICFGLMMSGFSGHAVVPSLYRDMKNPQHFSSMINVAYVIAFAVSMLFAILGYCMFGNSVSAEITRDLSRTQGYPVALTKVAVWMVAINPLVKYAVANKPLVTTFEHLIGLHPRIPPPASQAPLASAISTISSENAALVPNREQQTSSSLSSRRPSLRPSQSNLSVASYQNPSKNRRAQLIRYWVLRPVLSVVFVLVAIAIPDFDRVLSFLGSASAFVICCVGPIGAYLILSTTTAPTEGSEVSKDLSARAEGSTGKEWNGQEAVGSRQRRNGFAKATETANARHNGIGASGSGGSGDDSIETITPSTSALLIQEITQELSQQPPTNAQRHWLENAAASAETGETLIISRWERALCWVLLVVSILMALVGTVWSFLPEF